MEPQGLILFYCLVLFGIAFFIVLARTIQRASRVQPSVDSSSKTPIRKLRMDNHAKGDMGEMQLLHILQDGLDPAEYYIMHDVMIPTEEGTTQIDFIVVCHARVFVIEAKTTSATVFGSARDEFWTYRYDTNRKHQNPIQQNQWHIQKLAEKTGLDVNEYVRSIIAFSDNVHFGRPPHEFQMHFSDVPDYIKRQSRFPKLSDHDVDEIIGCFSDWNRSVTPEQRAAHVANLKKARDKRRQQLGE